MSSRSRFAGWSVTGSWLGPVVFADLERNGSTGRVLGESAGDICKELSSEPVRSMLSTITWKDGGAGIVEN